MNAKEKLAELIIQAIDTYATMPLVNGCRPELKYFIADYLLANGVIVPPCKVGQTVWCIYNYTKPKEFRISILTMSENHYSFVIETKDGVYKHYCDKDSVGKWVFFNKEQAEAALAERSKE